MNSNKQIDSTGTPVPCARISIRCCRITVEHTPRDGVRRDPCKVPLSKVLCRTDNMEPVHENHGA